MRDDLRPITMGSLFDGIGGFPLAAVHCGIRPLWASEIETFPIEVKITVNNNDVPLLRLQAEGRPGYCLVLHLQWPGC